MSQTSDWPSSAQATSPKRLFLSRLGHLQLPNEQAESRRVPPNLFLMFAIAACEEQGTVEQTGEAIDNMVEQTSEMVEEDAEKIEESLEEVE